MIGTATGRGAFVEPGVAGAGSACDVVCTEDGVVGVVEGAFSEGGCAVEGVSGRGTADVVVPVASEIVD